MNRKNLNKPQTPTHIHSKHFWLILLVFSLCGYNEDFWYPKLSTKPVSYQKPHVQSLLFYYYSTYTTIQKFGVSKFFFSLK